MLAMFNQTNTKELVMSELTVRTNRKGDVTFPFSVVGAPEPDLNAMLRDIGAKVPNQPVPVTAAVLATEAAKRAGRKVLGS